MGFKMKFDIEFKVYPKAVVCYASPILEDRDIGMLYYALSKLGHKPKNKIKASYKGTAVYKNGDEFDVELGKEIARKKAIRAAYQGYMVLIEEMEDLLIQVTCDKWKCISNKWWRMNDEIVALTEDTEFRVSEDDVPF